MFSLDQLQAFQAAAECGSFSAAARKLGKAQSAISTAIINLEIDCGLELFDRSKRQPVLTPEGEALLKDTQAILQRCEAMESKAQSMSEGVESQLVIALDEAMPYIPFLEILRRFEQQYPDVELELLNPVMEDVAELVKSGRADMGLMFTEAVYPEGLHVSGVGNMRFIEVVNKAHPLASRRQITFAELEEHRQLVVSGRDRPLTHNKEILSRRAWRLESHYAMIDLVKAGFGWALLPEYLIRDELRQGQLVALDFVFQQTEFVLGVDLVWTQRRHLGQAGQWLLQSLAQLPKQSTL